MAFAFCEHIRRVCRHACDNISELRHVDIDRIGVGVRRSLKPGQWGIYASITPLRFEGGAVVGVRRGREVTIQRVTNSDGHEMLYLLAVYLPRFMDLPFREKLVTLFHELWHISPEFNGDIRRFAGRCYAHTGSQKKFDDHIGVLADRWLRESDPDEIDRLTGFLQGTFSELLKREGAISVVKYRQPKFVPKRAE